MLDITVRYDEKDATVRYVPGKVTLDAILKRYADTPFVVTSSGPVVTIARTSRGTLRGWTERTKTPDSEKKPKDKDASPPPIQLFVDFESVGAESDASGPAFSLADPPADGLAVLNGFEPVKNGRAARDKPGSLRFVAKLYETVALAPGEIAVPVNFTFDSAAEKEDKKKKEDKQDGDTKATNQLAVVLRTTREASVKPNSSTTDVALIGGTLDLQLGHLCDQQGCVNHFYESIRNVSGLGAVSPQPSLESPRATAWLRAGQPIDLWSLRESLRDRSIEISGMRPRDLKGFQLRIELPRWQGAESDSGNVQQCMTCREHAVEAIEELDWASGIVVAGGGINLRPKTTDVNLTSLLDALTHHGVSPSKVWLVPTDVPMPKAAPPLTAHAHADPERTGSRVHPLIEFELGHTCDIGANVASLLFEQKWASQSGVKSAETVLARASIADRKYAGLTPLLNGLRTGGLAPREVRLRDFGDIRVQLEFAHICGDVVYSKPPKPKKKKDGEKAEPPKKPFVPQPLSMAASSNGRKAIQAAIESVEWVKDGKFLDYHTKFEFRGGPRKITFALEAGGEDVVRIDELIASLRKAGFPPKSVVVSRRFPGIPFGKPFPDDLELTGRDGSKQTLASFKKSERPLAVAFICLKTKSRKYGKYAADPKLFARLGKTIDAYQDRVDIVAISANQHDEFPDVVEFWDRTGLKVPLVHDAEGKVRAAFNMQIAPPPHLFVFDEDGLLRYGGEAHSHWEKPEEKHDDYLAQALDLVLARKFLANGAVFYNKSVCNCSHPKCKCPKCGCGSTCRCGIKHCGVGF